MIPVISETRLKKAGGMWTDKMGGDFQEGDPSLTAFTISGRVDIKELNGHLKLFFEDVILVKRILKVTEYMKTKFLEDVRNEEKMKKGDTEQDDSDDEELAKAKEEKERIAVERKIEEEKNRPLDIPKLSIYLSTKKPKARMIDVHISGTQVRLNNMREGIFGKEFEISNYEVTLKDIPDVLSYQGVIVLKLPQNVPVTDEPIIYGFARLQSYRSMKLKAGDALHFTEIAESISTLASNRAKTLGPTSLVAASSSSPSTNTPTDLMSTALSRAKPLHIYRKQASITWAAFEKAEDDLINFKEFLKMLDHLNVFLVTTQSFRLFKAVDVGRNGMIGISEFENFLMANDIIGSMGSDLIVLDVFDSLKSIPLTSQVDSIIDPKKVAFESDSASVKRTKFINNVIETLNHGESGSEVKIGLDYSGYIEAIQTLGVKDKLRDDIIRSFCHGAGVKEKDIETTYLDLTQFRRAWLKVADLAFEMKSRGMKYEDGVFSHSRNRERLFRALSEIEDAYLDNIANINEVVEKVKQERRRRKDERRREQNAYRDKLLHEANKFIAVRAQEKRLLLKKEQEEKSKKRLEDKILKNKLLLRQQENLNLKRLEISDLNKKNQKLKQAEIRALGLDRMDWSVKELRLIPRELYNNQEAQLKLSYLVSVDFSHNLIDELPAKDFFYWMTDVRKLKLSTNKLRCLPSDLAQMVKVETLEVDSNRLESLPQGIESLTVLQRLDVSHNHLDSIPDGIGQCVSLRYFSAHSNKLRSIPSSLGGCTQLEYINFSRNELTDLPEDWQNLISLTHLDLSTNQIKYLPTNFGSCRKLAYLDLSKNSLALLPESFANLQQLEYCNLEHNEISAASQRFNHCHRLKYLNLQGNHGQVISSDIGFCTELTLLKASSNTIEYLPAEIGLLVLMQELNISRNHLVTIPPELGSCVALQKLDLSYNKISGALPETIGLIRSLMHIDVSFNHINCFPESIIGMQELVSMKAEHCMLNHLPHSIVYLEKLQILDLRNNRFTRFPIELKDMKRLKTLNLSDNAISLLQKNINEMSRLDSLDLSKNQLRALPVEFTEVLESVRDVQLVSNPWTDLPPKWGKLWPNSHQSEGKDQGYVLAEAVDFLYAMKAFYDTAERIWEEFGAFHYTGKLSFEDFLQELRNRIPKTWHEGLVEYAKHLYFTSRAHGMFTRWYALDKELSMENERRMRYYKERRNHNVLKAKEDETVRFAAGAQRYRSKDLTRRIRQVNELAAEHQKNDEVLDHLALQSLHSWVEKKDEDLNKRQTYRLKKLERRQQDEMVRLKEILFADQEAQKNAGKKTQLFSRLMI